MSKLRLRREGLVWSDVGGETVLLDLESSAYFAAKGSGSFIVNCLTDGATEDSLVERLVEHYEVDLETAKGDVSEFLRQLEANKMLERVD
jgi:coenzyme PQQ synthesis protein D (PqqD)